MGFKTVNTLSILYVCSEFLFVVLLVYGLVLCILQYDFVRELVIARPE